MILLIEPSVATDFLLLTHFEIAQNTDGYH
jgi:hypothetical protein